MPGKPETPAVALAIDSVIHTVRGERVTLDADLAKRNCVDALVLLHAVVTT